MPQYIDNDTERERQAKKVASTNGFMMGVLVAVVVLAVLGTFTG